VAELEAKVETLTEQLASNERKLRATAIKVFLTIDLK
jgi:hypothetical protein